MSEETKSLAFTLADHDLLLKCVSGIGQILEKITAITARADISDTALKELEKRVKSMEDWKIKVMTMAFAIGLILGYFMPKPEVITSILPKLSNVIPLPIK